VLDEFADAHEFARLAEGFFRGVEGGDGAEGPVRAVQVPREEAGEVLQGAEELVATDWGMSV
jgi:hypothetical protein